MSDTSKRRRRRQEHGAHPGALNGWPPSEEDGPPAPAATPAENGQPPAASPEPPPVPPLLARNTDGTVIVGRYASEVRQQDQRWIVSGILPEHCLTLAVGPPGAGKSTFGAWLCKHAKRPAVIGSAEESTAFALVPRLLANGCDLKRVLLLDGRPWTMPADRARLAGVLSDSQTDVLWIDPIDSLLSPDDSENDGRAVRTFLESLAAVAAETKCTIVAARHPGKAADNVCPGSRQWRAVPRLVLRLTVDAGPPERRFMTRYKCSYGRQGESNEYTLLGEPAEPKRWSLGPVVSDAEVSLSEVTDRVDRWRIHEAEKLLRALLADGEQPSKAVYAAGDAERINERLMRRAGERIGAVVRREGVGMAHQSFWSLPKTSTPATPDITQSHTPPSGQGGVSDSDVRSVRSGKKGRKRSRDNGTSSPG